MKLIAFIVFSFITCGLLVGKMNSATSIPAKNYRTIHVPELQTGDIILRNGKGIMSDFFRKTSLYHRDYSHAGFVFKSADGKNYVCHMIGGNEHSGFRMEKLQDFIDPADNSGFAVYRYLFMKEHQFDLVKYLKALKQKNPAFDEKFDLGTDDKLYCTEMIYKALGDVCHKSPGISEFNGHRYVAIDNLYESNESILITKIKY